MKTAIKILLFVVLVMPNATQAQTLQEELIGSWLFDDQTSFNELPGATQAHFDSIPQEEVTAIKNLYIGRKLTFNEDGSFLQELLDGRNATGSWMYDSTTEVVTITTPQGVAFRQAIQIMEGNRLLLIPLLEDENINVLIDKWYYTKL